MENLIKKTIIVLFFVSLVAIFTNASVYAEENISGDINNDNRVSALDLSILKKIYVENKDTLNDYNASADVNGDGNITVTDISTLKLCLIQLNTKLSEEQKEEIEEYLNIKNARFIAQFEFSNPSEINDIDLLLEYLYDISEDELGLSQEKLKEIDESLGYKTYEGDILMGAGHLSTISKIKENYYSYFGQEMPDEIIVNLKNNKNYLLEYDAIYWINPYTETGVWVISEVEGEFLGNIYKITAKGNFTSGTSITLKRVNNVYHYMSIK